MSRRIRLRRACPERSRRVAPEQPGPGTTRVPQKAAGHNGKNAILNAHTELAGPTNEKNNSMKRVLLFLFIFAFYIPCTNAKEEMFYDQITRAVVRLEEHQSICTPGRDGAIEKNISVGSAFFVEDRLSEKSQESLNRYYIVTARHVVENHADLFARVQAGPKSTESYVLYLPRDLWVFHPKSVSKGGLPIDVAVMRIEVKEFLKSFLYCSQEENTGSCGVDSTTNKPYENQLDRAPIVTDRALFFGFPPDISQKALEPFARSGMVAYTAPNPDLRIDNKPVTDELIFYLDAPAFPGNSGGPVVKELLPLQNKIRLFGLVTGNSRLGWDYTLVTSVDRIRETLVHARSQAKINSNSWSNKEPSLPIQCESGKQKNKWLHINNAEFPSLK